MALVNVNVAFCDECGKLISPKLQAIQLRNKLFHMSCFRAMTSMELIDLLEIPHDLGYIKSAGSIGETGVHNSLFVKDKEREDNL